MIKEIEAQVATKIYDVSSSDYLAYPFKTYQALLAECPVYCHPKTGDYFVSDLEHIKTIFRYTKGFSSDRASSFAKALSPEQYQFIKPLLDAMSRWLLFKDAPKHMPLRRIINASLNHKLVAKLEGYIEKIARQLIDEMKANNQQDLLKGLAYPLPAMVIAHLLGVPDKNIGLIKQWSDHVAHFLGAKTGPAEAIKAQKSIVDMSAYLKNLLIENDKVDTESLVGNLKQFQLDNPDFSDEDLIANCILLLFAGHETTTYLISNMWYWLQRHPEQMRWLRDHPDGIAAAIEEGIRFDGPVHRLGRMITEDVQLGEHTLKKDKKVFMLVGAANRSEALCEYPNQFDIQRLPTKHMGFGFGAHLCSGAALGRLEAQLAINLALQAFSDGQVIEEPEYLPNLGLRAMKELKICIE